MICFVILHYVAGDETINCVNSILNNVKGDKKVIIVDNCSPNNSYSALVETYKDDANVVVLETGKNLGFAKGNNYGYSYAIKTFRPKFIVVMNNDMEIKQSNFIAEIENCYKKYSFFIMGPDIYSTKGKYHQNPQTRKLPTYRELKKAHKELEIKYALRFLIPIKWFFKDILKKGKSLASVRQNSTDVDQVTFNCMLHGSCYIFSKDFIKLHPTECFYNKTFMYMEAEILYYLALKNHEKIVYCPSLKIDHHEDVSTDLKYKKQYKKSIFSVKCLMQSTGAFLELMRNNGDTKD